MYVSGANPNRVATHIIVRGSFPLETMHHCFEGISKALTDEGVDHPDSYYQRQYMLENVAVSVSIKDQIRLQETYVFVGIQGASSE